MTEETKYPLVTFALVSYNQEKHIREAVEAALAQDYPNLEIILSDDCSKDGTFEIIKDLASAYAGAHQVVVRQSPTNRGLGRHFQDVVQVAKGDFLVAAAGDDISLPSRTRLMVDLMRREGAQLGASNFNRMNNSGELLTENERNDYSSNYLWEIVDADPSRFVNGATAVYKRSFLLRAFSASLDAIRAGKLYNEDIFLSAFAIAEGRKPASYCVAGLVNYRVNPDSLSNFVRESGDFKSQMQLIRRQQFWSMTRIGILDVVEEIAMNYPEFSQLVRWRVIARNRRLAEFELMASHAQFLQRLQAIKFIQNAADVRVWLVRLFGERMHGLVRVLSAMLANRT